MEARQNTLESDLEQMLHHFNRLVDSYVFTEIPTDKLQPFTEQFEKIASGIRKCADLQCLRNLWEVVSSKQKALGINDPWNIEKNSVAAGVLGGGATSGVSHGLNFFKLVSYTPGVSLAFGVVAGLTAFMLADGVLREVEHKNKVPVANYYNYLRGKIIERLAEVEKLSSVGRGEGAVEEVGASAVRCRRG